MQYLSWPGGSVGWSIILYTKLWVRFPIWAHTEVAGSIPVGACTGGNQSMFLSHIDVSLSLSLFLSKINKHILR